MRGCRFGDRRIVSRRLCRLGTALGFAVFLVATSFARASDPPRIAVRHGSHAGYERLVFDWRDGVEFRVERDAARFKLIFGGAATIDVGSVAARLGGHARDVTTKREGSDTIVSMTLGEGVEPNVFRNNASVVLDLKRDHPASAPKSEPVRTEAPKPDSPKTAPAKAAPTPRNASRPTNLLAGVQTPGSSPPSTTVTAKENSAAAVTNDQAIPESDEPRLNVAPMPPKANPAAALAIEVEPSAAGYRLRFPFREPVGLAAFMRSNVVWIVTDRSFDFDLKAVHARRADLGQAEALIVETPASGTALRFASRGRRTVAASRSGDAWIVEIGDRPSPIPRSGEIAVQAATPTMPGRVVLGLAQPRNVLRFKDPESADEILVVTSGSGGSGIIADRAFPEFRVLPAQQGALIKPTGEHIVARPSADGIEVIGDRSLAVADSSTPPAGAAPARQALFDLRNWRRGVEPKDFVATRQEMHRAIADARPRQRGAARLALAQFLFAHAYPQDALGLLRMLEIDKSPQAETPAVRGLRAAAAVMSGDLNDADGFLAHPSLSLSNEIALWRGMAAAMRGDHGAAIEMMSRGVEYANRYPAPIAPRLLLTYAESLLAMGDITSADHQVHLADGFDLGADEERRMKLLRARMLAKQNDREGALKVYAELIDGVPSPSRAAAVLDRVELRRAVGELKQDEAIAELERLRLAWRGDDNEFRTLRLLAAIQTETGTLREALLTLREATTLFPEHRQSRETLIDMTQLFGRIFLEGEGAKMTPVQTVAMFEEFRELIPPGPRGDAMVTRIVERLIGMDLVEKAQRILEHQITNRVQGVEKAEAGARLALVHLIERRPGDAISALASTITGAMPLPLRQERARLEARALSDMNRVNDALARLDGDQSADADRLRAEILWRARDWPRVAVALGRLVPPPPIGDNNLATDAARHLLHQAVAIALAEDKAGLQQLRERYGAAAERSEYAEIFKTLFAESGEMPRDVAAIARSISGGAPFQPFLQAYRERIAKPMSGS
jgi:tetratricopeptide (TPR) repeat protein